MVFSKTAFVRPSQFLLWCTFLLTSAVAQATSVNIAQGWVEGIQRDNSILFKGIPYAASPAGELRWQPPQATKSFAGLFKADQYGLNCPQRTDNKTGENCLNINVFTPYLEKRDQALPVLVWVHGGGYVGGSGDMHDNAHLNWNNNGIILVTFNYRLGALGIFAPNVLEQPTGSNYSLMDMVAALKWVQTNIGAFGGDPSRVTIAGGSAGGMAVQMLMTSPSSKGLFQAAISQSGYGAWPLPRTNSASRLESSPNAHQLSEQIARRALSQSQATFTAEQLYALSPENLVEAIEGFHLPMVDGITLPDEPAILFLNGKQHAVPYISGGNSYEGSVYPYSGVAPAHLLSLMGEQQSTIQQLYGLQHSAMSALPYQHLFGDFRYVLAAKLTSESMIKVDMPGYRYFFDYVDNNDSDNPPGATHGVEAHFLFNQQPHPALNAMRQYWINFVKTHNPNSHGLSAWPPLSKSSTSWLSIGQTISILPQVRQNKLTTLEEVFNQRINPL